MMFSPVYPAIVSVNVWALMSRTDEVMFTHYLKKPSRDLEDLGNEKSVSPVFPSRDTDQ